MKHLLYVPVALAALAGFAGLHRVATIDGADQWERAAYMVWQGQCERGEVWCVDRSRTPCPGIAFANARGVWTCAKYVAPCTTDSDCEEKFPELAP